MICRLFSVFKLKSSSNKINVQPGKNNSTNKVKKSSKAIGKDKKKIDPKHNFAKNCNILKKLMAKKKK